MSFGLLRRWIRCLERQKKNARRQVLRHRSLVKLTCRLWWDSGIAGKRPIMVLFGCFFFAKFSLLYPFPLPWFTRLFILLSTLFTNHPASRLCGDDHGRLCSSIHRPLYFDTWRCSPHHIWRLGWRLFWITHTAFALITGLLLFTVSSFTFSVHQRHEVSWRPQGMGLCNTCTYVYNGRQWWDVAYNCAWLFPLLLNLYTIYDIAILYYIRWCCVLFIIQGCVDPGIRWTTAFLEGRDISELYHTSLLVVIPIVETTVSYQMCTHLFYPPPPG